MKIPTDHALPKIAPVKDETFPIPELTKIALGLAQEKYQAQMTSIIESTIKSLGGVDGDTWDVNLDKGIITKKGK